MKKQLVVMFTILTIILLLTGIANAEPYGRVTISGIAKSGNNFIVLASNFEGGGEASGCTLTDWWLPGTSYAFWLPMTGNEELYKDFMIAYLMDKKVWIDALYEHLAFAAGVECRIRISDKATVISDFQ